MNEWGSRKKRMNEWEGEKMKKIKLVLLIGIFVCLGCLIVGCNVVSSSSGGGGRNFFPNGEGYTWRTMATDGPTTLVTFEGTTTVDSTTVQIYKQMFFDSGGTMQGTSETYFQVTDSAVYLYGYSSSLIVPAQTFLQFPLAVGNSWTVASVGSTTLVASVTENSSVTVPAGTFNCYRVDYVASTGGDESTTISYWFGENAGIVKGASSSSTTEVELAWKSF